MLPNVRLTSVLVFVVSAMACGPRAENAATAESGRGATTSAPAADTAWVVRPGSIGPIRVGMRAAEARRVLGLPAGKGSEGCSYLAGTAGTRIRANVMLSSDTVVRFDVLDSTMATAEGARVGDTDERIRQLYAGRVAEQPHKYVAGGDYLIVTPAGGSLDRIVFETDGKVVTKYRAGRRPEVEYVEGCG
jgi:hypothetical protein